MSFIALALPAGAASTVSPSFTLDGRLYSDATGTLPLLDSDVTIVVQVLSSDQTCILYEETQTHLDTQTSSGHFSIQVGSVVGAGKRSALDSGTAMSRVYSNTSGSLTGKTAGGSACTYTPSGGDVRYLKMIVTPASDGVARALTPNMMLDSVAMAVVAERAESLQGYVPSDLIKVNTTGSQVLTQANVESIFTSANYSALTSLLSGSSPLYSKSAANGTSVLPALSSPSSPAAGQIWYDSGAIKFYNGSSTQTLGVSGAGITSLSAGTGLNVGAGPGGTITSTGTLNVDVGTTANKIVQLDGSAKLPAVDGSQLTNLPAPASVAGSTITGTIGGSTAINTSGNITTSGNVSATNGSFSAISSGQLSLYDSATTNTNYVTLKTPATATLTADYTLTLPAALPGSNGQVLTSDTLGNLSWSSLSAGSVASVTSGNAPIVIGGTASAPTVALASGVATAGTYKSVTVDTYGRVTAGTNPTTAAGYGLTDTFVNGGNSFGANATIGTNDNHSLGFKTNNAVKMTMLANGNVGIGTATPGSKLHVVTSGGGFSSGDFVVENNGAGGNWASAFILGSGGGAGLYLGSSGSPYAAYIEADNSTNSLVLGSNAQGRLLINSSGNVGIGTTSPSAKLEVTSGTANTSGVKLTNLTSASPTSTGQAIGVDASGNIVTISSGGGGTVTSVTSGGAPIVIGGTTAAPTVSVSAATTSASGVVTLAADGGTTASTVVQATDSRLSNSRAPNGLAGGDLGGSYPNPTVAGISGKAVTYTSLTSGDFLKYNGTGWVNVALSTANLSDASSLIKSSQMPSNCSAGSTLTFSSPTNTWSCTTITGLDAGAITTGTIASGRLPASATYWSSATGGINYASGNVGIGTTTPAAYLDVYGAIKSRAVSNSSGSIDFSTGNYQYTSSSCGAITLNNLKAGSSYTLAVQGSSGGTCSFTAYSDSGTTALTVKTGPASLTQTAGKHTLFTFVVMGSYAYVASIDGY